MGIGPSGVMQTLARPARHSACLSSAVTGRLSITARPTIAARSRRLLIATGLSIVILLLVKQPLMGASPPHLVVQTSASYNSLAG